MAPVDEAISVLEQWEEQGFEIAIVTGRPPETAEVSRAWLARHRIAHGSFTVVDKYSRFTTDSTAAISLTELSARRFCWAVEDSLPMAHYLAGEMKVAVVLLDRPWNRSEGEHIRISRYRDWHAIAAAASALTALNSR